jgi:hypothetical protein
MVAVPCVMPVTTPDGLMVATAVAPLLHVPPDIESDNSVVPDTHRLVPPVIGAIEPLTVTAIVAAVPQPLE